MPKKLITLSLALMASCVGQRDFSPGYHTNFWTGEYYKIETPDNSPELAMIDNDLRANDLVLQDLQSQPNLSPALAESIRLQRSNIRQQRAELRRGVKRTIYYGKGFGQ